MYLIRGIMNGIVMLFLFRLGEYVIDKDIMHAERTGKMKYGS